MVFLLMVRCVVLTQASSEKLEPRLNTLVIRLSFGKKGPALQKFCGLKQPSRCQIGRYCSAVQARRVAPTRTIRAGIYLRPRATFRTGGDNSY